MILKQDIKNAFRNVSVAPHQQWLLGFMWKRRYYKKICLLIDLSTISFIFNLFGKGLYWILVCYLNWILVYYLDDFVAVFSAGKANSIRQACYAYKWVINLLEILRNDSKDTEGTQVIVFGIEIDTENFTAKLPTNKLAKAIRATGKILAE